MNEQITLSSAEQEIIRDALGMHMAHLDRTQQCLAARRVQRVLELLGHHNKVIIQSK
jgi:hypothetical protein